MMQIRRYILTLLVALSTALPGSALSPWDFVDNIKQEEDKLTLELNWPELIRCFSEFHISIWGYNAITYYSGNLSSELGAEMDLGQSKVSIPIPQKWWDHDINAIAYYQEWGKPYVFAYFKLPHISKPSSYHPKIVDISSSEFKRDSKALYVDVTLDDAISNASSNVSCSWVINTNCSGTLDPSKYIVSERGKNAYITIPASAFMKDGKISDPYLWQVSDQPVKLNINYVCTTKDGRELENAGNDFNNDRTITFNPAPGIKTIKTSYNPNSRRVKVEGFANYPDDNYCSYLYKDGKRLGREFGLTRDGYFMHYDDVPQEGTNTYQVRTAPARSYVDDYYVDDCEDSCISTSCDVKFSLKIPAARARTIKIKVGESEDGEPIYDDGLIIEWTKNIQNRNFKTYHRLTIDDDKVFDLVDAENFYHYPATSSYQQLCNLSAEGNVGMLNGVEAIVVDLGGSIGKKAIAMKNVGATSIYGAGNTGTYYKYADASALTPSQLGGEGWRLPTKAECEALIAKSNMVWNAAENGYQWSFNVGDSIHTLFLPAAGFINYNGGNPIKVGEMGDYWTSQTYDSNNAHNIWFDNDEFTVGYNKKTYSFPLRAFHDLPVQSGVSGDVGECYRHDYKLESFVELGREADDSYEFSNKQAAPMIEFTSVEASKGIYKDRVRITANVKFSNAVKGMPRFTVYRRVAESENITWETIYEQENNSKKLFYYDDAVSPGIFYEYRIVCTAKCGSDVLVSETVHDVGFTQILGTVAGNITYGSGTSVADVDVHLTPNDGLNEQNTSWRAKHFATTGGKVQYPMPAGDTFSKLVADKGVTMQMWVQLEDSLSEQKILSLSPTHYLGLKDGQLQWVQGSTRRTFNMPDMKLTSTEGYYALLSMVFATDKTLTAHLTTIGADGDILTTSKQSLAGVTLPQADTLTLGGFVGSIDDFRCWSRALADEDVTAQADRYLVGNEADLYIWYNFDEPITSYAFDYSGSTNAHNNRHAVVTGAGPVTVVSPALGLKATTDAAGCYTVRGVPFSGSGTNYTVTPKKGIHTFSPESITRVVSEGTPVPQAADFTDTSSFPMHIHVTYAGTTIPVDSVSVMVDGGDVSGSQGTLFTNADGYIVVDVPIGKHKVSIKREGHDFEGGGVCILEGDSIFNFQQEVGSFSQPIEMLDNTRVAVMGRVVGGKSQSAKPWSQSAANIGAAEIVLSLSDDSHTLNATDESLSVAHTRYVTCDAEIAKQGNDVTIHTNEGTGEFCVLLPPVPFYVKRIATPELVSDEETGQTDFGHLVTYDLNLATSRLTTEYIVDAQGTMTDSLKVAATLLATYRSPVHIEMWDESYGRGTDLFGDDRFSYEGTEYPLIVDGKHAFGLPTFTTGSLYRYGVRAYEVYKRPGDLDIDAYEEPCAGMQIGFLNGLGRSAVDSVTNDVLNPLTDVFELDDKGMIKVKWVAGYPNLEDDHTLQLKLRNEETGEFVYEQTGVVLGSIPVPGSTFVTSPQDMVFEVIHDPYGTASYAYHEKGFSQVSVRQTQTLEDAMEINEHAHAQGGILWKKADKAKNDPVTFMSEDDSYLYFSAGENFSYSYKEYSNHSTSLGISYKNRISTSSDPHHVGAEADLFVGMGVNTVVSDANGVWYEPADKTKEELEVADFLLASGKSMAMGTMYDTEFSYTRKFIENTMLPNLDMNIRDMLRTYYAATAEDAEKLRSNDEVRYVRLVEDINVPLDSLAADTAYVFLAPDDGRLHEDMVHANYNGIQNWKSILEQDERIQYDAERLVEKRKGQMGAGIANYSISSGVENAIVSEKEESLTLGASYSHNFSAHLGTNDYVFFNKCGVQVSVGGAIKNTGGSESEGTTTTEYSTYGCVLRETQNGNFLSQDVIDPLMVLNDSIDGQQLMTTSYVFILRGGQTQNPHEECLTTKYFNTKGTKDGGLKIGQSTQHLCVPVIQIKDGDGASKVKEFHNLRIGQPVAVTLLLNSLSPQTNIPIDYWLRVAPTSHSQGLGLTVGGTNIRQDGIPYTIYTDQVTEVTLLITPTSPNILDYEDVRIQFGTTGSAQWDVFDDVSLTLHYVPASSPVSLKTVNRYVTTETANKLNFVVDGYDRQQTGFACIDLLYREKGEPQFHNTLARYWVNEALRDSLDKDMPMLGDPLYAQVGIIGEQNTLYHAFDMSRLLDGDYEVQALSRGYYKATPLSAPQFTTEESDILSVRKDTTRPALLGQPTPTGGTLNANSQLSVTFNETIDPNSVKVANIDLFYTQRASTTQTDTVAVSYNYSVSDRTIVITPTMERSLLQGKQVTAKVHGVRDVAGNTMDGDISWKTTVRWLPLTWEKSIYLNQLTLQEPVVHTGNLVNTSGRQQTFRIETDAKWLEVWPTEGIVDPNGSATINFLANDRMTLGNHTAVLRLYVDADAAGEAYTTTTTYALSVNGKAPIWEPADSRSQDNMSVVLKVLTNTASYNAYSVNDRIAAFVGKTCVGVTSLIFNSTALGNGYATMTIHKADGIQENDSIEFRLWSGGKSCIFADVRPSKEIRYRTDALIGSIEDPVLLTVGDLRARYVELEKGWTWMSIGLDTEQQTGRNVFDQLKSTGDFIVKSNTYGIVGNKYMSNGNLLYEKPNPRSMYAINVTKPSIFYVEGKPFDIDTLTYTIAKMVKNSKGELEPFWTWLSYIPEQPLEVATALQNLEPVEGDLIKGMTGFAVARGGEWVGSLELLMPGRGYKFCSSALEDRTFTYSTKPVDPLTQSARRVRRVESATEPAPWELVTGFADNMTVLARVYDGDQLVTDGEIGAFTDGDVCRGKATVDADGYAFIVIQGDQYGEQMKLRYWDGAERPTQASVSWSGDAMVGTFDEPFYIQLDADYVLGIDTVMDDGEYAEVVGYYTPSGVEVPRTALQSEHIYLRTVRRSDGTLHTHKFFLKK